VQYPLRRLYGDDYRVAPLSVLVDPTRAARILGLEHGPRFSPKVQYIYEKQLEEADIVVINKSDLLTPERRAGLEQVLKARFAQATVVTVSTRTGADLDAWFRLLSDSVSSRPAMDVDYDVYADGEALLGWLNATCSLSAPKPFDGNRFLEDLGGVVQRGLEDAGAEVAHFKMTLSADTGSDLAVLNLVRSDTSLDLAHRLADDLSGGELILNLRAEADPERLKAIVDAALQEISQRAHVFVTIEHSEHFRPGRPQPTHRMATP
jgi:G3E family GTPase